MMRMMVFIGVAAMLKMGSSTRWYGHRNLCANGRELHRFLFGHTDFCVAPKLVYNKKMCENKKSV
jgi:hypothetical protein